MEAFHGKAARFNFVIYMDHSCHGEAGHEREETRGQDLDKEADLPSTRRKV